MGSSMATEIMANLSMGDLASRLGTDEATARRSVEAALPALLAGMTVQAADPARSAGLAAAVREDHDPDLLARDGAVLEADADEGEKIVDHVFGSRRPQVETDVQGFLGGDGDGLPIGKLLPILAPLVMSYLKSRMTGPREAPSGGSGGGLGGLGDILGSILGGGGRPAPAEEPAGGGIGDILGEVFGGARKEEETSSGGVFDDILDGIRDKGRKERGLDDILGSILGR